MFRNMLWCYVFLLTFLDLSLNSKLSAQGESHGKIDFPVLILFPKLNQVNVDAIAIVIL